jgi:hypothetical protein
VRLCVLELEHEVTDARPHPVGPQQPCHESRGQRGECNELPPEEVVGCDRSVDEREDTLEDRPQPERERGKPQRRENATHPRRRSPEAAHDQRDERGCEQPEEDNRFGLLEDVDDLVLVGEVDEAVSRLPPEAGESARVAIDEARERGEE